MNKHLLLLFILSILALGLQAQIQPSKLAPNLQIYLHQEANHLKSDAVVFQVNHIQYLSALIKVNETIDERQLQQLGVSIGTKAGDIWTVRIPDYNVLPFTKISGIDYIELDRKVKPLMDSVRYFSGIDSAHQGIAMPVLSGKNIVVGVVDFGFDLTHPAFYDTTYTHLRIKRVWIQDGAGTPPAGYNYGSELKDTSSILTRQSTDNAMDHGTTVASAATGSGYGSMYHRQYRGVAYESDIVLVESNSDTTELQSFTYAGMLDAINYIFNYAKSVGKPAVINISLGVSGGPHDGTSLFAQACETMSGPGRVLVFGAGNDGLTRLHLEKTFTATDTSVSSLLSLTGNWADFEFWGEAGKNYCIELGLSAKGVKGAKTQRICLENTFRNINLIGTDGDTSYLTVGSEINRFNNKPRFAIRSLHQTTDTLYLTVFGTEGTGHMWIDGEFMGNGSWASDGDARYSVSEFANCLSCFGVGAYSTKISWRNIQNQKVDVPAAIVKASGDIALFSSRGPTADGRMKPDITAPGSMLVSAVNSYSSTYRPGGPLYYCSVRKFTSPKNNRDYFYAANQGTSVASPVVAGSIALMLQANPNLHPGMIKTILAKTAIKDQYTTNNPDPTIWGPGKLNVYAALKETILTVGTVKIPQDEFDIQVYPNPTFGRLSASYLSPSSGYFLVEVHNVNGQLVHQQAWELTHGQNTLPMDVTSFEKGMYILTFYGQGGQISKRIALQ